MMQFAPGAEDRCVELGYRTARDVILDPRGRTVRCTPRRRTVLQRLADGTAVFRKLRYGTWESAAREWWALRELPRLGFVVPQALCLARDGRASAVVLLAVPGRPVAALFADVGSAAASAYLGSVVAPLAARLHGQGLAFRDLYWNHLFARDLSPAAPPALIDVERVFAPCWRWRRWVVKDLAGLVSSWPWPQERAVVADTLVAAYLAAGARVGGLGAAGLGARVLAKAGAIAARRPRYGA